MLAVLTRDQIAHAMFPLGDTPKAQVREEARRRGLLVADKPDSHDVCFIADGDTGVSCPAARRCPRQIVDRRDGPRRARRGFGFTVPAQGPARGSAGPRRPARYVLSIEPVTRTVTVGRPAAWRSGRSPPSARSGRGARRRRSRSSASCNCAPTARSTLARRGRTAARSRSSCARRARWPPARPQSFTAAKPCSAAVRSQPGPRTRPNRRPRIGACSAPGAGSTPGMTRCSSS